MLARRDYIENVGRFDPTLLMSQDYDLWLHLAKRYKFYYLDEPLAKYRKHDSNISHNYKLRMRNHFYILAKPELREGLTDYQVYVRQTNVCVYLAEHAVRAKRYLTAAGLYLRAVIRMPYIGAFFWPKETWGKRFTLPYRILKYYYFPIKYLVLGIRQKLTYAKS